jgi:hypothetical protein
VARHPDKIGIPPNFVRTTSRRAWHTSARSALASG